MPDSSHPSTIQQLYSRMADTPSIPEAIADSLAERTVEYLRRQVIQLFQDVLGHEQAAAHNQHNLNQLMARYHIEKSRISEITDGYGRLPWYQRYAGGVLFVAASALVGAVFNLAALFSILAIGLHYTVTTLLMEHYTLTTNRDELFCKDIINMEKKLAESIDVLVDTDNQVNALLTELRIKNSQSAEHIQTLDAQAGMLTDKVGQLTMTINALEQTCSSLMRDNERITRQFQHASSEMAALQQEHAVQSSALDAVTHQLEVTNKALWDKTQALTDIYDQFQRHLAAFAKQESEFKAQINRLQTQNANGETTHASPTELKHDTQALQMNTDQLLTDSDALLTQVKQRHDDDSESCLDTKTKDMSTEALLARVARQMDAFEISGLSPHFKWR